MKTKNRIFLAALALFLAAAVSLSAGGDKEHWAKMKQELNLTDAQVTQLQQKFEALRTQGEQAEQRMKAIRREIEELERATPRDDQALRGKREEQEKLTQEWHERSMSIYRTVLSKDQLSKFEEMQIKERKEKKEYSEKKKKD